MLKIIRHNKTAKPVKVTDCEGNTETFKSAKDAAAAMEVAVQSIYQAISSHKKLCGCTVERI